MKAMKDGSLFICLRVSPHDFDNEMFGDYIMPVYKSLNELIENNPGAPYIEVIQKNNRLTFIAKEADDVNVRRSDKNEKRTCYCKDIKTSKRI